MSTQAPPQLEYPVVQGSPPQVPPAQMGEAREHAWLHPPQSCEDVSRLAQRLLPQAVSGGWQVGAQPLGVQIPVGALHARPQAPQVIGVERSASHPSAASLLQSAQPG